MRWRPSGPPTLLAVALLLVTSATGFGQSLTITATSVTNPLTPLTRSINSSGTLDLGSYQWEKLDLYLMVDPAGTGIYSQQTPIVKQKGVLGASIPPTGFKWNQDYPIPVYPANTAAKFYAIEANLYGLDRSHGGRSTKIATKLGVAP